MKHVLYFDEHEEHQQFIETSLFGKPKVSYCTEEKDVVYRPKKEYPCLKFTAQEPNSTIRIGRTSITSDLPVSLDGILEYSLDEGDTWNTYTLTRNTNNVSGETITLSNIGDSVMFRGTLPQRYWRFYMTNRIAAKGNVTSLFDGVGGDIPIISSGCARMFYSCTSLTSAPELPSTTLGEGCYENMFYYCSGLITGPSSIGNSATTASEFCCSYMFDGCSSLITAPELPAGILERGCYYYMFNGCTSLKTPPSSIGSYGTTASYKCCYHMFYNCYSLETAPELPATIFESYCYYEMFYNCSGFTTGPSSIGNSSSTMADYSCCRMFYYCKSLVTPPELPSTSLAANCYSSMFYGCTSLTTAPELPAVELVGGCYNSMFYGCSSLNYIKALMPSTNSGFTNNWVANVNSAGTFVKSVNSTLPSGVHGIPSTWIIDYDIDDKEEKTDVLTFKAQQAGSTVKLTRKGSSANLANVKLEYSTDNGVTWSNYALGETITLTNIDDTVKFKGNNDRFGCDANNNYHIFVMSGKISAEGDLTSISMKYKNHDTILRGYDYVALFSGCTALTSCPDLPVEELALYCYDKMFQGCTSITVAPELPATTLAEGCYSYMFHNCTNLTTPSDLPSTVLPEFCYSNMYWKCSKLATIPNISAVSFGRKSCEYMFQDCYALVNLSSKNIGVQSTSFGTEACIDMFSGCTNLTSAPSLPATNLTGDSAYKFMFEACSKLATSPSLPATTLGYNCYYGMLRGTNAKPDCTNIDFTDDTVVASGGLRGLFYGTKVTYANLSTILPKDENNNPCLPISALTGNGCYGYMFAYCTSLTKAPELPAEILSNQCYTNMFEGCSSLTSAPNLNASVLNGNCYSCMFRYCRSLANHPNINTSITSLPSHAFDTMFYGCSALTSAYSFSGITEFGAYSCYDMYAHCNALTNVGQIGNSSSTLGNYACCYMFYSCSNLTTAQDIPCLYFGNESCTYMFHSCKKLTSVGSVGTSASTLGNESCESMFKGCTSLTTAPELPAEILSNQCYISMFEGCSSLTTAPELPATELATYCYRYMFYNCSGMTSGPSSIGNSATTIPDSACTGMFVGCKSLERAPELPATELGAYAYSDMFNSCYSLSAISSFGAINLNTLSCSNMFAGCSGLTSFSVPIGNNESVIGNSACTNMFSNCKSLERAPELPAKVLSSYCYYRMFYGCNSLNYIKIGFLNTPNSSVTKDWAYNVASAGTFVKSNVSNWTDGIPNGWTVETFDEYLTFTSDQDGSTIALNRYGTASTFSNANIQYSLDNGTTWNTYSYTKSGLYYYGTVITLNKNQNIKFRGNRNSKFATGASSTIMQYHYFAITGKIYGSGNIASLSCLNTSFSGVTTASYYYSYLFKNCTGLITPPEIIHSDAIGDYAYYGMFSGCSSLTTPPKLPATTLSASCYSNMFDGCSSLTTAPELPCKSVKLSSYAYMFRNCTSLEHAPELPATSISGSCYSNMFNGCTSLKTPPSILPANTLYTYSYSSMFYNCTSLEYIPVLPFTGTLANYSYNYMFYNCSSITRAELNHARCGTSSCAYMFYGCSSLNYIKTMMTTSSDSNLLSWVYGVASAGTFVKKSNYTAISVGSANGIPVGWTVENI